MTPTDGDLRLVRVTLTAREARALARCARLVTDVFQRAGITAGDAADRLAVDVGAERLENALVEQGLEP